MTRRDATTIFDKLAASAPIDRSAALTMARGDGYVPAVKVTCEHWSAPPPMRPVAHAGPEFSDLTGVAYGRLKVIGVIDRPAGATGSIRWVVRCACGDYEVRTSKAIKRATPEDRCTICRHAAFLQRTASHPVNGGRARG